jgi:hypothetical protein
VRHFQIAIDIDAPPARVWEVMSDVERWHEWTPSVRRVRRLGRGPLAVGSRVFIRQPKFPPAVWRVTDIDAAGRFTWVSRAPGLRVLARHSVEPNGVGSRATLSLELQGLFGGVFGSLTRGITERYLQYEASGLKSRSRDPAFHHCGLS